MESLAPYLPEDFADFWSEVVTEASRIPLAFRRTPTDHASPFGHRIDLIDFTGANGASIHGWIAYPEGAKRLPAFLWIRRTDENPCFRMVTEPAKAS